MLRSIFHKLNTIRRLGNAVAAAMLGLACAPDALLAQDAASTPLSLKRNLALDSDFLDSEFPSGATLITAPRKFGPWSVDLGSIGIHANEFVTLDGIGNVVDLNGTRSGSLYQAISTVPGKKYTVRFLMSGNWTTNPDKPRGLSLRFGNERMSWTMTRPAGWSKANMGWQVRTAEFVAASITSGLRFSSDSPGMPDGAVISRIEVRAEATQPGPLDSIPVPLPENLADFVQDRDVAVALGKAFFWDMQVGSDGKTACASCHSHAGADIRTQNTLHPGAPGSAFGPQSAESRELSAEAVRGFRGPNQVLKAEDFPFHRLNDPLRPGDHHGSPTSDNPVIYDTPEIVGSQGVVARNFLGIVEGSPIDAGVIRIDPVFSVHGVNLRQVTGRNAPTTINAVFFDRSFWDGRANRYFNGVNEFGDLDANARVLKATTAGKLEPVRILLDNAALASQAVGPVNSPVEMSWLARSFPEVGRKMLSLRPLAMQKVAADDSVLGSLRHSSGRGLDDQRASYDALIRSAFRPEWWSGNSTTADGYTHMEANFSLFWGLSIMLYEATLVSDKTPYDNFVKGDESALSPKAKEGLKLFLGAGKCINCHGGPEFAGATVSKLRGVLSNDGLIEFMPMEKGTAYYDGGFYNIGVRPTHEDLGLGAQHPVFGPLSYSRQEQNGRNPDPKITIRNDARITVDGAFKSPTMRNIELTGPYMHNGGMKSLEEVVQFYTRGADFRHKNLNELDPDVDGIPELQGNPEGIAALVEFLKHLTDPRVRHQAAPFDHPEILLPNGHSQFTAKGSLDNYVRVPETGKTGGAPIGSFEDALKNGLVIKEPVIELPAAETPGPKAPVVEEPIIEEPIVEEPIVEEPVIEEPVIEEPVIEEPVIEEPVVEEPVVEEPIVEEPVVEEPIVEEPVIEEPVVEEPVVEEPVVEEPVIEEPVVEEPVVEEPVVEEPVVEEPGYVDPEVSAPVSDDEKEPVKPGDGYEKDDEEPAKPDHEEEMDEKEPVKPGDGQEKDNEEPAKPDHEKEMDNKRPLNPDKADEKKDEPKGKPAASKGATTRNSLDSPSQVRRGPPNKNVHAQTNMKRKPTKSDASN